MAQGTGQGCLSCGRDTAPGTILFAARKPGVDTETGTRGFLCHACQPGSAGVADDRTAPLSGRYAVIDFPGGYPS